MIKYIREINRGYGECDFIMGNLSFGIWIPPVTLYPDMFERWELIENLGFDSIWNIDHFTNPIKMGETPWLECWTSMAALAARTRKIRIGTLVTNMIYRNPATLAKQIVTVDHLSNGRLTFGIGAGASTDPSHPMTGVEPWGNKERVERFREFVEIFNLMMTQEVSSYDGRYYKVKDAIMVPLPVQKPRPPLLIAAKGPKMLKLAANLADNWNFLPPFGLSAEEALEETKQRNEMITHFATEAGRDPDSIDRSLCAGWTKERPFDSKDNFIEFVNRYREIGINEFHLGFWTEKIPDNPLHAITSIEMLETIAHEAIPEL